MSQLEPGDAIEFCSANSRLTTVGIIDSVFNSKGWWLVEVISSNAPHLRPGMFATVCETDIVMGLF